jgi:hypothetical protein
LLDRRSNRGIDRIGAPERSARVLVRLRELALELNHPCRIGGAARAVRVEQSRLEIGQASLVVAVNALRDVLERADGLFTRFSFEKSEVGQLVQRDRGQETLGRPRAEHLARLIKHEQGAQLPLGTQTAHVEPSRLAQRRHLKQPSELVAALSEVDELSARRDGVSLACR